MGYTIKASKGKILIGMKIDSGLIFKDHITNICSTANQILDALINKGFQIHELTKAPHSYEVIYHFAV